LDAKWKKIETTSDILVTSSIPIFHGKIPSRLLAKQSDFGGNMGKPNLSHIKNLVKTC